MTVWWVKDVIIWKGNVPPTSENEDESLQKRLVTWQLSGECGELAGYTLCVICPHVSFIHAIFWSSKTERIMMIMIRWYIDLFLYFHDLLCWEQKHMRFLKSALNFYPQHSCFTYLYGFLGRTFFFKCACLTN